jgi:hypothetical protein
LPALEHHTYREDDVEDGGIKIKKNILIFHENDNFWGVDVGKKVKKKNHSNHHFWMSEGSLSNV